MAAMRVEWAEGTPERAWVELRIRLMWAFRPLYDWLLRWLVSDE